MNTPIISWDIMKSVKEALGFRLKLGDLAEATLDNVTKSADGLQAIRWWREGKIDEIKKYCEQDVRVTKEIYDFGKQNNQLFYLSSSSLVVGDINNLAQNKNYTLPKQADHLLLSPNGKYLILSGTATTSPIRSRNGFDKRCGFWK